MRGTKSLEKQLSTKYGCSGTRSATPSDAERVLQSEDFTSRKLYRSDRSVKFNDWKVTYLGHGIRSFVTHINAIVYRARSRIPTPYLRRAY